MKFKLIFAIALTAMFTITGCSDGPSSKCLKHVDENSDYKCDKCGENLPFIDSDKISNDFTFDVSFPEESLKQFLGSGSVFKPSSTFTGKGTFYAQNQTDGTMTVVYAVDFSDENLELLCEEMFGSEDLFSFDTRYTPCDTFGSKNDIYTVSCSSKNFGSKTYLINTYFKNNVLYEDKKLTTNTSWSSEAELVIGERLPFFKMGEGYKAERFPENELEDEYILIKDNYAKYNLKDDIVSVLIDNGFYYVPSEDNYQKPSDDYNLYAYKVEFLYYYGTQVKLTKSTCASKTFQGALVKYAVLDAIDFDGEVFNMDLSTKEFLGEQIAPEYRATITNDFVSISGLYANLNEFLEVENKYLDAGYKIVKAEGDDSSIYVELVYIRLTVILELNALRISDEGSNDMYYDFDYSTFIMTFTFTNFNDFPSTAISQFFEGQTSVEIPPIEALYYSVITSDDYLFILSIPEDMTKSYYDWVNVMISEGWVVDEVDYLSSNGNYAVGCFKDNITIGVFFMIDATNTQFIDFEICINELEYRPKSFEAWPEEEIAKVSLGKTEVELPGIDDPENMTCYGFMQKSPTEYSIFGYGLYTAEEYAGFLEEAGFVGEFDSEENCYSYTKGNLTVKVYEGMIHFRVDVVINL